MVIVFDLDDTLYDEIDFVKSGFREISAYLQDDKYYNFMIDEFYKNGSGKVFNKLIEIFNLDISLQKLVEIYRFHKPNINLSQDSIKLLEFAQNYKTALISDGHYITQKNKFDSLGLDEFINYTVFTDFHHTKKPELKPFEMVMKKYPNESYIYISDNPKKDFIAPNKLEWCSIRYRNNIGIYKKYKNNATFEVENRLDIIDILLVNYDKESFASAF
jgi:putative hydrolase of the HAD superfamily